MSRYGADYEPVNKDGVTITGAVWVKEYAEFTLMSDGTVTSIRGFPPCQECFKPLTKEFITGSWKCWHCDTVYDTATLIRIIEGG